MKYVIKNEMGLFLTGKGAKVKFTHDFSLARVFMQHCPAISACRWYQKRYMPIELQIVGVGIVLYENATPYDVSPIDGTVSGRSVIECKDTDEQPAPKDNGGLYLV